ncbi:MAG TPA: glycosyltransferase family 87 protein [Tepidisphaeraceae bacterium]|jgi:hypothetical protein|nr:glycosyltransferase family 87 protein [Tepidisphaeraceae bacterium]
MQPNVGPVQKRWHGWIGLIGILLLLGGLQIDVLHQISKGRASAELTYYRAAGALRHGNDPYVARGNVFPYVYPPLYALCFEPLTFLSQPAAARVMLALNSAFILAALLLCMHAMRRRVGCAGNFGDVMFSAMIAAVIVSIPIHNELRGLETNSLVLLSFALAFYWIDRHPVLAGIALAAAINIKYLPIIAVPYFLLRRRWTAAAATLIATVAIALLPALSLGWSTNLRYLHEAVGGLGHLTGGTSGAGNAKINGADDLSSLSITSTVARLSASSQWSKPIQLGIVGAVAAVWGACILLAYKRRGLAILRWPSAIGQNRPRFTKLLALEWGALVTFAVAFSPNTQNRNLVLAIIPATYAVALLCAPIAGRRRAIVAGAAIVLAIGLTLPVAFMGKPFTVSWLATGGPCWCLLIAFVVLSWVGTTLAGPVAEVEA